MGWAYITIWKVTQSPDLLAAAIACADALAANVQPGNATASPWPFRVHAKTGEVQEIYGANTVWSTRLFDALLSLPAAAAPAINPGKAATYMAARKMAWDWQMRFPMVNGNWCGYHEDIATKQAWHDGVVGELPCNYNSMTPLLLARHLLQQRLEEITDATMKDAHTLIAFVESHLIFWNVGDEGPGPSQPAVDWGARCVSEQKVDRDRMGRHTTRYASVLALYADVLRRRSPGNLTAVLESLQMAKLARYSWNWSSYCLTDEGIITVTPRNGEHDAWFTQTSGFLLNTAEALAAWPSWAPSNQTHFLRSDSVVTNMTYGTPEEPGLLLRYSVYSGPTLDRLRLASAVPTGRELSVTAGGIVLPLFDHCSTPCTAWWRLNKPVGVLEVEHNGQAVVEVQLK